MMMPQETVSYRCPKTGKQVDTGVTNTASNLARWWRVPIDLDCPHCRKRHRALLRDIYVDMTVSKLAEI